MEDIENQKYIYGQINEWIRVADQKALVLGSFNVIGFIFQLVKVDGIGNNLFHDIFLSLAVFSSVVAFYFWIRIIYPNLDNKNKKSKIYFLHIANKYENDVQSGIEAYKQLDMKDFKTDLASQIVVNSVIAKRKYQYIQKFTWIFSFQIIFIITTIIIQKFL